MQAIWKRASKQACVLSLITTCVVGCSAHSNVPDDPMEGYNRKIYGFNKRLDRYVMKPVAKAYRFVFPKFVRTGVTNFFSNVDDITVIANDVLQFHGRQIGPDVGRFLLNTTIGVVGFWDVASIIGLEKHDADFGQTLGVWGIKHSPYFVLPILGPSTLRDTVGIPVDLVLSPWIWTDIDSYDLYALKAFEFINTRANLLDHEGVVEVAALDEYSFVRDAYLKHRRYKIYYGHPPSEPGDNGDDFDQPEAKEPEKNKVDLPAPR